MLSLDQSAHFDAQFFLTPTVGPDEEAPCSVVRRRLVDHVWIEEITVTNHLHVASGLDVAIDVDTDFADLFEVKDGRVREREVAASHDDTSLTLTYARDGFRRSVTIAASSAAVIARSGFAYQAELAAGEQWSVNLTVSPRSQQPGVSFARREPRSGFGDMRAEKAAELETWLITSFQALPYLPGLAATTLRSLARQAETRDDFHEQEPGKILHELRYGELTARGERPHSPYYGTADATPLFLILLDEYHRWTGLGGLHPTPAADHAARAPARQPRRRDLLPHPFGRIDISRPPDDSPTPTARSTV